MFLIYFFYVYYLLKIKNKKFIWKKILRFLGMCLIFFSFLEFFLIYIWMKRWCYLRELIFLIFLKIDGI